MRKLFLSAILMMTMTVVAMGANVKVTMNAISKTMTSSKHNTYGMTTPAYFCFDNLGGKASDCKLGELTHVLPYGLPATFEEIVLSPDTAWYGDPTFVVGENAWTSGTYTFSTYVDDWGESGVYYYDVTVANLTSKTFSWMNPCYDQYSAAGGAAQGNNYAVWYSNWYGNANVELLSPAVISGMAVTNNAWVVEAIKNGDGMSIEPDGTIGAPFGRGDSLVLIITGYDDQGTAVGQVKYFLADFRDTAKVYDWTYAENWQWIDLTSLGTVKSIGFSMTSSKHNTYGMTTPVYFCFDNLGGKASDCKLGDLTHVRGIYTGIEQPAATSVKTEKMINNGVLYILRDGKVYTTTVQEVR